MRHLKIYLLMLIAHLLFRSALRRQRKAMARTKLANAVLSRAVAAHELAIGLQA